MKHSYNLQLPLVLYIYILEDISGELYQSSCLLYLLKIVNCFSKIILGVSILSDIFTMCA